jgi:4-diphosphocytidyl-2-C-methyl-D-erythritol kinase
MIAFPGCKINLGLHILNRRSDGYHDLDTCFFPVPWTDILEVLPSDKHAFHFSGLSIPGDANDNLCLRAYHLLQKDFSLSPIQGHLHKIVPMGAGLGGGSADAAHTLRILNSLFELGLSGEHLKQYAKQLGSDCAFFLQDQPAMGAGRGEVLEPIDVSLKNHYLVVVTPPIHVGTAQAYAAIKPQRPERNVRSVLTEPVTRWKELLKNDFEDSVFRSYPEIERIKQTMYVAGAVYASMSGSGSSVFGIFDKIVDREEHFPGLSGWSGWL